MDKRRLEKEKDVVKLGVIICSVMSLVTSSERRAEEQITTFMKQ